MRVNLQLQDKAIDWYLSKIQQYCQNISWRQKANFTCECFKLFDEQNKVLGINLLDNIEIDYSKFDIHIRPFRNVISILDICNIHTKNMPICSAIVRENMVLVAEAPHNLRKLP